MTQNQRQIWIYLKTVLCTAEHCSLRSRKSKRYEDIKSRYPNITATMEKLLYFWVDKSHKRATNSTVIRANLINCLLYILKVLLNLHNFPELNINCTELYLGPLYRGYIMVQILNCKIPERVLLNGALWKKVFKGFTPLKMCCLSPVASFYFDRLSTDYRPLHRPFYRPIERSTLPTVNKIRDSFTEVFTTAQQWHARLLKNWFCHLKTIFLCHRRYLKLQELYSSWIQLYIWWKLARISMLFRIISGSTGRLDVDNRSN